MALDIPALWGKDIADAVKAIGVSAGSEITDVQLEAVWAAVVTVHTAQLAQAAVAPGSFTGSIPVTGVGGPIS